MNISPEEVKARIEQRDIRIMREYGPGFVQMSECMVCGWLRFEMSNPSQPNRVLVSERTEGCPQCNEVRNRTPEVFQWMMHIINRMHERAVIDRANMMTREFLVDLMRANGVEEDVIRLVDVKLQGGTS